MCLHIVHALVLWSREGYREGSSAYWVEIPENGHTDTSVIFASLARVSET